MTPGEIVAFRTSLPATQSQLARLIGATTRTVARWEHGAAKPAGASALVLLAMMTAHRRAPGERLDELLRLGAGFGLGALLLHLLEQP